MKMEAIPYLGEINGVLKVFGIFYASSGALVVILGAQSNSQKGFMTKKITTRWKIFGYACCFVHVLCCSLNIMIQKKYISSDIKSKWNSYPVYVITWSMLCYTLFAGAVSLTYIGQPDKPYKTYSSSNFAVLNLYSHWIILYFDHMVHFSN